MYGFKKVLILLLAFFPVLFSASKASQLQIRDDSFQNRDSILKAQILYNGRVWRNLYMRVRETQFLFSSAFMNGSVVMNGRKFDNLPVLYDIYNDEILTPGSKGTIIQLNKEMVDSFDLTYNLRKYRFAKLSDDSVRGLSGYVNILYPGKSTLYLKYRKEIALLEVDDRYDKFYQINRLYIIHDGVVRQISSRKDLLRIMEDHKAQVRNFMRRNNINVSRKDPDSFVPVVRYYDSLGEQK